MLATTTAIIQIRLGNPKPLEPGKWGEWERMHIFFRDFPCASHQHVLVIRQGNEGERQVDSCLLFSFSITLFLLTLVNLLQPLTHPPEAHYAELAPCYEVESVGVHMLEHFTSGIWSNLANWWTSKQGCDEGPNIFSSDAFAVTLSVFFLSPSPVWNISTLTQIWAFFNMNFVDVSRRSWPCVNVFMVCLTHVLLFYGCFPPGIFICLSLSLSLVVHLFAELLIKFNGASKGRVMSLNRSQYQLHFKATSYLYRLRWQ